MVVSFRNRWPELRFCKGEFSVFQAFYGGSYKLKDRYMYIYIWNFTRSWKLPRVQRKCNKCHLVTRHRSLYLVVLVQQANPRKESQPHGEVSGTHLNYLLAGFLEHAVPSRLLLLLLNGNSSHFTLDLVKSAGCDSFVSASTNNIR